MVPFYWRKGEKRPAAPAAWDIRWSRIIGSGRTDALQSCVLTFFSAKCVAERTAAARCCFRRTKEKK